MRTEFPLWIFAVLAAGCSATGRSRAARKHVAIDRRVTNTILVAVLLAMTCRPAVAAPTDYDGKWRLDGSCSASTLGGGAITFYSNVTFQNGSVSGVKEYVASGIKAKETGSGVVQNNTLNLVD